MGGGARFPSADLVARAWLAAMAAAGARVVFVEPWALGWTGEVDWRWIVLSGLREAYPTMRWDALMRLSSLPASLDSSDYGAAIRRDPVFWTRVPPVFRLLLEAAA